MPSSTRCSATYDRLYLHVPVVVRYTHHTRSYLTHLELAKKDKSYEFVEVTSDDNDDDDDDDKQCGDEKTEDWPVGAKQQETLVPRGVQ